MENVDQSLKLTTASAYEKLPDVASSQAKTELSGTLAWVGMSQIQAPIYLADEHGVRTRHAALVDAFVSLDNASARGIHMSRLYREVQDSFTKENLSLDLMGKVTDLFLSSHLGLSQNAKLEVKFEALLLRSSLLSNLKGWRTYPVKFKVEQTGQVKRFYAEVVIVYSSTCPASAALARSLTQQSFDQAFNYSFEDKLNKQEVSQWLGETLNPTPHAQRSEAKIQVELKDVSQFSIEDLINNIEQVLQTAVQTVVKREDEQEFARRNGENLMFCEDAARKVQTFLKAQANFISYIGEFRHLESLHAHDAVAFISSN
jgi:GTP cyclohydrolase IB